MTKNPKILSAEAVCQSRLFNVEQVELEFSNGEQRVFERISSPTDNTLNSVMAIPLLDKDTLLLVREYGVGLEQYHIGFPKGLIDAGEHPQEAVNRELKEEVHYGANRITPLMTLAPSPAYLNSMMAIFVAEDMYPQVLQGDEPEPLEVIQWKLSNIDELLHHPDFIEARSVAALLYFLRAWTPA